ncbi:unnamed protein product, partial [Adineta steineri]
MFIFGLLTVRNIHQTKKRIEPATGNSGKITKKDIQFHKMLANQICLYLILNVPNPCYLVYRTITLYTIKSPFRLATETFVIPPTSITTNYTIPTTLLTKHMCYLPDGTKYERNYLRQLVTERESTVSLYRNNTRAAIMSRRLIGGTRILETIFRNPPFQDMIRPSCDGLWMEFGVFRGNSLTHIADWKR